MRFDLNHLEQDAKEVFSNPLTRLSDENQARVKAWSKNTFSVSGRAFAAGSTGSNTSYRHYRFDVRYSISSEVKEAIYYKSDYKNGYSIMART